MPAGTYAVWIILEAETHFSGIELAGKHLSAPEPPAETTWVRLGQLTLPAAPLTITIPDLPAGPRVGRVVLTTDPSSNLPPESP